MRARAQRSTILRDDVQVSEDDPVSSQTPDVVESCVALLIERLARDPQLAESFERTPGKIAHLVGIPYSVVPEVLDAYWKKVRGNTLP